MVFLFILDIITSATLHIVASCGYWVACKTSNGVCYLYNKFKIRQPEINNTATLEILHDSEYVVITREEYNRMKSDINGL